MLQERIVGPSADLSIRVIRARRPNALLAWCAATALLRWKIRNALRWNFILGWAANRAAKAFTSLTGIPTIIAELEVRLLRANGEIVDYGVVSYRLVTAAGVAFLVDDWDANGQDISTMNYHGCGTGVAAEAAGDTALGTESTTALNPDSTRATGTRSQPAANQYRSVGTLTFDASAAVTEHGLLSQAAKRICLGGRNRFL